MRSRSDRAPAPMPVAILSACALSLLGQACAGPDAGRAARSIHEGREQFVRLATRPSDPRMERAGGFAHPLRLAPAEWTRILSSIRIQSRKDSILFTTAKELPVEAFAPDESAYLGTTLSAAFARARPDEWVDFGLSRVAPSGVNELTTGGWFAEGDRLHLVLANYRHAAAKAGVRERIWRDPLDADAAPFYEVAEGEYLSVQPRGRIFTGLRANEGPEIVIRYKALLGAASAGAPPRPPPAPAVNKAPSLQEAPLLPADTVEERLRTLKRLREEGFISEEEYRAKKKELLDRF